MSGYECVCTIVGTSCKSVFQSMTCRFTWILGYCFSKRLTRAFQYGSVKELYWAITTFIVPLGTPAVVSDDSGRFVVADAIPVNAKLTLSAPSPRSEEHTS